MSLPSVVSMNRDAERTAVRSPHGPDGRGECAVVIADAQGIVRFVSANFELVCGYSRYEILGKSVRALRVRRRDGEFFSAVNDALRSGTVWSGTFATRGADGQPRTESATVSPVTDASGSVNQCVAVRRDATARKAREEALRKSRAMEAVARVAGGMAHNFNNLLTCILGHCDLLLAGAAGGAAARHSVQEIRTAGERAAVLTRQLLAFSREQVLMPKAVDLAALVCAVSRRLREQWGAAIEIRTDLDEDAGTVTADPAQVERALIALGAHAREAMPEGGRLTFTTDSVRVDAPFEREDVRVAPGRYIMLAVSDTGNGIDEGSRERIFEPFHSMTARAAGLDLAAVYGIVKQSGGYIWVHSSPGHGTTFEILLPQTRHAPAGVGAARDRAVPNQGMNRLPAGLSHFRRIDRRDAGNVPVAGQEGP